MTTRLTFKKIITGASFALALVLVQGCATAPATSTEAVRQIDPLEPFNRAVFKFNDGLDQAVIKPVAVAYTEVTPTMVRKGVTNFFGNINDIWSLVNNLLQAKGVAATDTLFRVSVNTFWGIGGLFDVASEMQIPKHSADFGMTLGYYGMASGPYLVLPLLGPSTIRDAFGRAVDSQGDVAGNLNDVALRNSLTGVRVVNLRSRFLDAGDALEQAALDKYSFTRDIYLQRRKSLIGREQPVVEERFDLPAPATTSPAAQ
ncbi:putative phospholipid-binding lipoprotein MlaA [Polaromonas vacuolata]|uniref:Putative phospholipid-binding lipoprotein MlaA n=1 Tax=Polaromonas vacuolata TaxID=37448 RepID=A0A6H2HCI6_9BURK|nr:VacJ family lipoprotein [Polaromonas vacuolata]QJC57589.1 putative phospholipid-binding lipoprotein MlaA [Polaromonas vacuolata]